MEILDRIDITYISPTPKPINSWDLANWSESENQELIWDPRLGDAINLVNKEFKLLQVDIDLDKLQCKYIGREL